jgi:methyl-accepting chemotaxis protein
VRTSNEAFGSVDIASTAAGELLKSIAEINRQLASAADVVRAAAIEAQSTNDDIADLAQAAQKIDDVVKLIQSVAGQTNLLALNATIEAARAGAAGKGFAVVASEVKALAVQTGKATDDIAGQIAAVQTSTQSAVRAIGNITGRMQEIREFTGAIAVSVEQQNTATGEISDNVAAAASGAKSVVAVLQGVADAIVDMHKAADTALAASQVVEQAADSLRGSVDGFLQTLGRRVRGVSRRRWRIARQPLARSASRLLRDSAHGDLRSRLAPHRSGRGRRSRSCRGAGPEDHHLGADGRAGIEVDDVVVGHADAA